jgi:hypothetical protein
MSKLIDRLNNLNKAAMPAMGFRTASSGGKSLAMIVLADVTGKTEDEFKSIADTGAAGGFVEGSGLSAAALAKYTRSAGKMNVGLSLTGTKAASAWKLVTSDIDFVIFGPETPVSAFGGKDLDSLGKVLALALDTDSDLLRSVRNIYPDIEAVLIDLRASNLTVEALMACRRLADFAGQHTLALVGGVPSEAELLALRGAGVKGLVLAPGLSADDIRALVEDVAALPKVEKRKDTQSIATLPKLGLAPAPKEEGEGGGEDGDDGDDDE